MSRKDFYHGRHYVFSSKTSDLSQEIYDFIYICANYFNLKPDTRRNVIFVMKDIMKDYNHLFPQIPYEVLVLSTIKFSTENSSLLCYEDINEDLKRYSDFLWKPDDREIKWKQCLWASLEINNIFVPPPTEINYADLQLMR